MNPSPRSIGHALADAVKPRVILAQTYLDEWSAMAKAGVPPHERRHALDRDVYRTPALDALKAWNGKGCLALVGAQESGKSHAAALWMLDGVRKSRRCCWVSSSMLLSWTDVEAAMTKATHAERFVFDDGGVGTLSQTAPFAEKLEAALAARHSKGRPTLFTSNCNEAGFRQIVGPRVLSRMKAGGEIVDIKIRLDLRTAEAEEIDEHGHGERWRRCHRLVSTFGHKRDDRFDEATNRVVHRIRVGDALEAKRLDVEQLQALAESLLVDWPALLEQAAAAERAQDKAADGLLGAVKGMQASAGARARTMARIIDKADNDVRMEKAARRVLSIAPVHVGRVRPHHEGRDGQKLLHSLGYRVKPLGNGYRAHWWNGTKLVPMSEKLRSERDAWDFAAGLQDSQLASVDL